jgi:hypothetical protein
MVEAGISVRDFPSGMGVRLAIKIDTGILVPLDIIVEFFTLCNIRLPHSATIPHGTSIQFENKLGAIFEIERGNPRYGRIFTTVEVNLTGENPTIAKADGCNAFV